MEKTSENYSRISNTDVQRFEDFESYSTSKRDSLSSVDSKMSSVMGNTPTLTTKKDFVEYLKERTDISLINVDSLVNPILQQLKGRGMTHKEFDIYLGKYQSLMIEKLTSPRVPITSMRPENLTSSELFGEAVDSIIPAEDDDMKMPATVQPDLSIVPTSTFVPRSFQSVPSTIGVLSNAQSAMLKSFQSSLSLTSKMSVSFDDFAYDGFSPIDFAETLFANALSDGIKEEDFISDMSFISVLVAVRGTNHTSILGRSKSSLKAKFTEVVKKYNIKQEKGTVKREIVTLSRIAAAFPLFAAKALANGEIRPKVKSDDLPVFLQFSNGACLIPRNNVDTYNKWLSWSYDFDDLINAGKGNIENVKRYGKVIHESSIYNDEERENLMEELENLMK